MDGRNILQGWKNSSGSFREIYLGPHKRLEFLLHQSANKSYADCGSSDPKWVQVWLCLFLSTVNILYFYKLLFLRSNSTVVFKYISKYVHLIRCLYHNVGGVN